MFDFSVDFQLLSQNGFRRISHFVAARPWTIVLASICLSSVLATGLVRFREVNDVRDHFGAINAPSRLEYRVAREFSMELGGLFLVTVALQAADEGSLLRAGYIDEALAVEEHLRVGLRVEHEQRQWAYGDFCGSQCENSNVVAMFLVKGYPRCPKSLPFLALFRSERAADTVKLTYPGMDLLGNRVYLGNNVFQVRTNNRSNVVESANLVVLYLPAIYLNESMHALMKKWEKAVWEYALATQNNGSGVRVYAISEGLVAEEVRQTSVDAIPLMPVCAIAVSLFTVISSLRADRPASKGWTALAGLLCPVLALFASAGALFWLDFEFLPILVVVPFLILAVGVDDVFIMLHCWAQTDDAKRGLDERLAEMLAHAGPSMGITSLTNWLSFTIGIWTPVPAIRIFCIFTSFTLFTAYLFQIFFYTAVMAISGRREIAARKMCPPLKGSLAKPSAKNAPQTDASHSSRWLDLYVSVLLNRWFKLAVFAAMLLYWVASIYGIWQLKVGLTTDKLFHKDSPLVKMYKLQTEVVSQGGAQMAVFVNSPGDLRRSDTIATVLELVQSFEEAPGSVGEESTEVWLRAYLPFVGFQQKYSSGAVLFSYAHLYEFLAMREYRRWRQFLVLGSEEDCLNERPECVQKFFFTTSYRGARNGNDKLLFTRHWRQLAAFYTELNATIYDNDSVFVDQLQIIPSVTIQTVCFALICMALVLFLFTPSLDVVVPGSVAVLSINAGVFGSLPLLDVSLDPISMITCLMAIGLSVDFVAHISFHYYRADSAGDDVRQRLSFALHSIAWPMVQAALSTILCVAVLVAIQAYMVQVFVKVVLLIVTLGLLHGLLILPIVYSTLFAALLNRSDQQEKAPNKCAPNILRVE